MNRKRLHKSSDVIISGVCGGIAEYFGVDPTLIRILAVVLVIVGFGLPLIMYVVLMIVLPPDPGVAQGYVDTQAQVTEAPCKNIYESVSARNTNQPPPPDPTTRVTAAQAAPYRKENSSYATTSSSAHTHASSTTEKGHWPFALIIGSVLVGVGIITLLSNFVHISLWRFWPVIVVVVGIVCLFTPGHRGWSLERAGNSIVLITVGLALLAWMFQIIQTRVFIITFFELWPVLLVVLGLSIIGSARKSSVISLLSSLILSATIVLGLWFYGGIEWNSLGATILLDEGSGLRELISDITLVP